MSDETRRAVVRALAGLVKPGVPADDRRLTFAVQLYELHGKEGGQDVHDWLLALADAPERPAGGSGPPSHGARTPCIRCTLPEATIADVEAWNYLRDGQPLPPGWSDREGSNLCWREVAKGDCCPEGPKVRITAGRLVLHDGDFALLSAPVEEVVAALREAGALLGPTAEQHAAELRAVDALAAVERDTSSSLRYQLKMGASKIECLEAELAQARADLAALLEGRPVWTYRRADGVMELRRLSRHMLAAVWDAREGQPAEWHTWRPEGQGVGGMDEAEAYLVEHGYVLGRPIRPVSG